MHLSLVTLTPLPRREAALCSLLEEHVFGEGTYVSCSLICFISPVFFLPFGSQRLPGLLPLSSGAAPPSPYPPLEVWPKQELSRDFLPRLPGSEPVAPSGLRPTHSPNGASDQPLKLDKKSLGKQPPWTENSFSDL